MTTARVPSLLLGRLDDVGDVRAASVMRILLGPIAWLHLRPFVDDLRDGFIWSDRFHDPWVSWYPEPGRMLSELLLWTALVAAVAMSIGIATRLACATTALIVTGPNSLQAYLPEGIVTSFHYSQDPRLSTSVKRYVTS